MLCKSHCAWLCDGFLHFWKGIMTADSQILPWKICESVANLLHFKLKQLWLLGNFYRVGRRLAVVYLHHAELFVGDSHDAHMTFFRQAFFHPLYMHICVLCAGAMAQVHAELEHAKAIVQQLLAKDCIYLSLFRRFSRQVKKNKYPHNTVCV